MTDTLARGDREPDGPEEPDAPARRRRRDALEWLARTAGVGAACVALWIWITNTPLASHADVGLSLPFQIRLRPTGPTLAMLGIDPWVNAVLLLQIALLVPPVRRWVVDRGARWRALALVLAVTFAAGAQRLLGMLVGALHMPFVRAPSLESVVSDGGRLVAIGLVLAVIVYLTRRLGVPAAVTLVAVGPCAVAVARQAPEIVRHELAMGGPREAAFAAAVAMVAAALVILSRRRASIVEPSADDKAGGIEMPALAAGILPFFLAGWILDLALRLVASVSRLHSRAMSDLLMERIWKADGWSYVPVKALILWLATVLVLRLMLARPEREDVFGAAAESVRQRSLWFAPWVLVQVGMYVALEVLYVVSPGCLRALGVPSPAAFYVLVVGTAGIVAALLRELALRSEHGVPVRIGCVLGPLRGAAVERVFASQARPVLVSGWTAPQVHPVWIPGGAVLDVLVPAAEAQEGTQLLEGMRAKRAPDGWDR